MNLETSSVKQSLYFCCNQHSIITIARIISPRFVALNPGLINLWKILQALLKLTRLVQCLNSTKHGRGNKGKTRKEYEKGKRRGEGKESSSIEDKHPDESGGNTEGAMGKKKPIKQACVRHDSRP